MSKLIYLSGKARSGKDEFAKIWIKYNPSFIRMAFADEIKKMTSKILGIKLEDLSNSETKEKYRAFLIFGGQLGRAIDPYIWVSKLINDDSFYTNDVIITDVRFRNEIHELDNVYCGKEKIIPIRVVADESIRLARGANPNFFTDISETDCDSIPDSEFKYTVYNNGSISDLEEQVKNITILETKLGKSQRL